MRLFGNDKHKVMDCNKTPCDVTKEKSMLEQLGEKMRIVEANVRRRNTITKLQVESDVLRRRNVGKTSPVSKVSLRSCLCYFFLPHSFHLLLSDEFENFIFYKYFEKLQNNYFLIFCVILFIFKFLSTTNN